MIGGPAPEATNITRLTAEAIDRGEPVVVATVVETRRSVPRHAGSKMLVHADGRTVGSVGGGEMEARCITEALDALADGQVRMMHYSLVDPAAGDPGVCGGDVDILLEPHLATPTLFVVGAGHVGRAVCDLAHWLGFTTVVWDDRSDTTDGLDHVSAVHDGSLADALAASPTTDRDYVVVVTRNVELDVEILPALLGAPARYIGVMGSGRRWSTTRRQLAEAGVADEALDRVHNPIGTEIQAETPEEIAVSILAEIIALERG